MKLRAVTVVARPTALEKVARPTAVGPAAYRQPL